MLFTELTLKPVNKKVSESMGNTFDSKMPEQHYIDKLSDLQYRLHMVESILKEIVYENPAFQGRVKSIEYLVRHKETK
tara:strand:+ start:113 stop:346 length:234 start_codon:yes stop_codon:yes gene_type:complete